MLQIQVTGLIILLNKAMPLRFSRLEKIESTFISLLFKADAVDRNFTLAGGIRAVIPGGWSFVTLMVCLS